MPISKIETRSISGPVEGRRNLIINGDMRVAQRGTSASVGSETFIADRFRTQIDGLGAFTLSQDTNAPDGFNFSSKLTCNTADASPAASDVLLAGFRLEGQDLQQLQYGTANAKQVTVSFWVKSNKTGTLVCTLFNALSSPLRKIVKTYTIDSADTWEYKTITIDGDTAYSISNSSDRTIDVTWWLGGGSTFSGTPTPSGWADNDNAVTLTNQTVNLADAVNNYWQITGVQLEVGDVATPFEHRSYGEELALCQRYYATGQSVLTFNGVSGRYVYKTIGRHNMRASPTVTGSFASQGLGTVNGYGQLGVSNSDTRQIYVQMGVGSGADGYFTYYADAEL